MKNAFRQLDRILRGEATHLSELKAGQIDIPAAGLAGVLTLLGMFYGACMGLFAITGNGSDDWRQIIASALKVPLLFLLTLVVTFPSLYVFNALVGSRLRATSMLRLMTAAVAVMMAILASLGTIVAFFSFSSTSYPFMVLLNVVVFAVSGFLGLSFLLQTLHRLTVSSGGLESITRTPPPPRPAGTPVLPPEVQSSEPGLATSSESAPGDNGSSDGAAPTGADASTRIAVAAPPALRAKKLPAPGALERLQGHVLASSTRTIFRIWVIVFGLVGAQMAWLLRPFVGHPNAAFELFRERQGNFFEDVFQKIAQLFS